MSISLAFLLTPKTFADLFGLGGFFTVLLWALYAMLLNSHHENKTPPPPSPRSTVATTAADGCVEGCLGCVGGLFQLAFGIAAFAGIVFLIILAIRWMWEKAGHVLH